MDMIRESKAYGYSSVGLSILDVYSVASCVSKWKSKTEKIKLTFPSTRSQLVGGLAFGAVWRVDLSTDERERRVDEEQNRWKLTSLAIRSSPRPFRSWTRVAELHRDLEVSGLLGEGNSILLFTYA